MSRGFHLLAPVYDALAGVVFGQNIDRSQAHFFEKVKNIASVLVVGGGTGRFLPEFFRLHPTSKVVFVEKSAAMMSKAQAKADKIVRFVETDFLIYQSTEKYDLVLLPFFLDMFTNESVEIIVGKLDALSESNTRVIVTDFVIQSRPGWKSWLLKSMYLFFRLTCDIEAGRLPNWEQAFAKRGWNIKQSAAYCNGMIGTHLLVKAKYFLSQPIR